MKKASLVFGILLLLGTAQAAEKTGPKVYISVDMEGIWGIVHGNQTSSDSSEYGPARKWMAEDVNAVVAGLFEAGAGEVVVNDSHGSMRNIIADALDPRASLISGTPKPLSMMQGVDGTFDACIFVGYHARAGTAPAILDHTISGGVVRAVRVNGQEMPELGLNAAIAGYYGVPVVLVSGDTAVCRQANEILGKDVVTVAVKEAYGRMAAKLVPFVEARQKIAAGVKEALGKLAGAKPYKLTAPFKFELEYHLSAQADMGAMILGTKRIDARTLGFTADDYIQGFRTLRAMIAIAPAR